MNQSFHTPRCWWIAGIGLALTVVAVVCVFLVTHNRAPLDSTALETSEPRAVVRSSPTIEPVVAVVDTLSQLPRFDFAPGSLEEACGFNELPTYSFGVSYGTFKEETSYHAKVLESDECRATLEMHMSAMNPQHFLVSGFANSFTLAELVVLDEPLTFERIFADPTGDLARVQEALSNPECLLTGDQTNWELKETCHADALLNYAFVNLFCFGKGVENRIRPVNNLNLNPTLNQDRTLWKQDLEDNWIVAKCEVLDPSLELTAENHLELHALVMSWRNEPEHLFSKGAVTLLVELAARLGDDVAGLSQTDFSFDSIGDNFRGEGYKFGRINNFLGNGDWSWLSKEEPSADRFLEAFHALARLDSPKSDPRDEFNLDWGLVARHLCEPPYYDGSKLVENGEHSSCKEIVHEIRQKGITFPPLVNTLDKFEQLALELGVYE
ncbi:MAG: hypothetical protein F4227_03920 [Gammaproteobacteria bacterium]|nr:hypothetical protein [Gammaproteobacteria bacterium]MYF02130.1 hypothetical protein [Gammaproteobacteria bacterium]MYI76778.1 hypothetical protein [Gammaproteobacteria bacterium]